MNRLIKYALLLSIFLCSSFLTARILPKLPLRSGKYPRVQYMASFEVPLGPEFFFAHSRQSELSQSIMYHNLDDSMDNARLADIIFIGDSRMPLGLREEFLMPKAAQIGVSLFSLGFGHVEKAKFGLLLIRKFNLKPKVVVVAGGPFIFQDSLSGVGEQAVRMTRWDAIKQWFEAASWWNIKRRLHSVLPKIEFFNGRLHARYIHYRSSRTGWWKTVLEPNGQGKPGFIPERKSYERYLPMAEEFKQEMDRIGALLVLTIVPYRNTQVGHLPYLSKKLGVPVVVPPFDGLRLADGSHLNRASAQRFSEMFWAEFIALPEVREKLSLGPTNSAQ
ncbi:hypothetical protein ACFL27_23550 [candidate division CSSED10-310 bacterium]|uniref:SGNH/GDSL hydrolase family protein n=1 Tax=candidate division CSSED10-310 bacterium TaxID=2855610 RepID=A0ABV6Z444_UNCC1